MPRIVGTIFLTLYLILHVSDSTAQGCSDAGFCTMGAMRPDQAYSKRIDLKLRSLEMNFYRGKSLLTPMIYATTIDATVGINDRNYIQIKVPYMYVEGSLGTTQGLGDISLSYTRALIANQDFTLSGTLGGKIPTTQGDVTVSNKFTQNIEQPLHMYYQPSLGTYDIVSGLSWINDKWLLATGIQVPLNRTNNTFLWGKFPDYPNRNYIEKYNTAPELLRGIDVMFRVERNWRFTNYNFSIGLLPIWRIRKDNSLTPESNFTEFGDRDGTLGMAMSALFGFGYSFDVNNSVKFIHGHKLTDREFNPDGLTRKTVNSFSYIYKF